MSSHLAVVASLALAILLSPETLVLGLIIASDKKSPRLAAFAFAIGGIIGIAMATGIGLWIAHASASPAAAAAASDAANAAKDAAAASHGSWTSFSVRAVLAAALLVIGGYRAVNAFRAQPIPDLSEPDHKPSRLRVWLTKHFPKVMSQFNPGAQLSTTRRALRGGLAGFAICGLHPKVFPIAIAAGHQIMQIHDRADRSVAVIVFAVLSLIPAIIPAIIELFSPGASGRVKEAFERIMKVHGRWITAALLLGAGAFVANNAWHDFPR